ncbi:methylated-DNA--[protein]-cysteine S-methyltransferase [Candidatus Omnitrophota bacterium]
MTARLKNFTEFEKKVYKAVGAIPLGQTRTYAWVAQKIGKPRAVRAVGTALKKNPFPLLIPCHRVITSSGAWGEYSGGKKLKENLLLLEKYIAQLIQ